METLSKKEKRKIYNTKLRLEALMHYCNGVLKCSCPGCNVTEFEFLTFDHINNNGAEFRKSLGGKSSGGGVSSVDVVLWLKKNNYPEGIQVLCWNCNSNSARQRGKPCPHMRKKEAINLEISK